MPVQVFELDVSGYVYSPHAASRAVMGDYDRNLGLVLVDIGAGTTKISFYKGGVSLIPVSCQSAGISSLTTSLFSTRLTFRTPKISKFPKGAPSPTGSTLKKEIRTSKRNSFSETQSLVWVKKKILSQIIEARLLDIFEAVKKEIIAQNNKGLLVASTIITGGVAHTKDIIYLAQKVLDFPTRIGRPTISRVSANGKEIPNMPPLSGHFTLPMKKGNIQAAGRVHIK